MNIKQHNINIPIIGYTLIINDGDAKNVTAIIKCIDINGPCTLAKKTGYLVDMVSYLEEMGVDRYEMVDAIEIMETNRHTTAHFGMGGTLIYTH